MKSVDQIPDPHGAHRLLPPPVSVIPYGPGTDNAIRSGRPSGVVRSAGKVDSQLGGASWRRACQLLSSSLGAASSAAHTASASVCLSRSTAVLVLATSSPPFFTVQRHSLYGT